METSIYQLLMWDKPQALQDLDAYQLQFYGCHIQRHPEENHPVTLHGHVEDTEQIGHLMRQAPSRSRE